MRKVFSMMLVLALALVLVSGAAWAAGVELVVSANTNNTEIDTKLTAAGTGTDKILNITGTNITLDGKLEFNIPAGVTVNWAATVTGADNAAVIELAGGSAGTLNITGSITASSTAGTAIATATSGTATTKIVIADTGVVDGDITTTEGQTVIADLTLIGGAALTLDTATDVTKLTLTDQGDTNTPYALGTDLPTDLTADGEVFITNSVVDVEAAFGQPIDATGSVLNIAANFNYPITAKGGSTINVADDLGTDADITATDSTVNVGGNVDVLTVDTDAGTSTVNVTAGTVTALTAADSAVTVADGATVATLTPTGGTVAINGTVDTLDAEDSAVTVGETGSVVVDNNTSGTTINAAHADAKIDLSQITLPADPFPVTLSGAAIINTPDITGGTPEENAQDLADLLIAAYGSANNVPKDLTDKIYNGAASLDNLAAITANLLDDASDPSLTDAMKLVDDKRTDDPVGGGGCSAASFGLFALALVIPFVFKKKKA